MESFQKTEKILTYFKKRNIDEESKMYLQYHCQRYALLLRETEKIIKKIRNTNKGNTIKILDIGPSFQTIMLQQIYPEAIINTLGFEDSRFKARKQDRHYQFDLNNAQFQENKLNIEEHDLIIMAEVIEHLYTSPMLVLKCILSYLKRDGHIIIQTPNACALDKRIKMLTGKNPYEQIRKNRQNPGHFREYTFDELISIGNKCGLEPVEYMVSNYFNDERKLNKFCRFLSNILPVKFREGMTICFKKKSGFLNFVLGSKKVFGIEEAGFHSQEWQNGMAVRWTNGAAELTVPLNGQNRPVSLNIDIEVTYPEGTNLMILVNEHELFNGYISVGRWSQTFRLDGRLRGDKMVIKLFSDTFIPREIIERSEDFRKLGVLVRGIRLLENNG
jgi:hypothetical protein